MIFAPYPLHGGARRFEQDDPSGRRSGGLNIKTLAPITVTTNPSWVGAATAASPSGLMINPRDKIKANDFARQEKPPAANSGFTVGNSAVGIRTEKMLAAPAPFTRSDCTGDDCADYSPLPKLRSPHASTKTFKQPYLGLSISKPLQ